MYHVCTYKVLSLASAFQKISPQVGRLAHKRGVPAPQIVKIEEKYGMRYYTFMARLIAEPPLPTQDLFKEEEEISKEKVAGYVELAAIKKFCLQIRNLGKTICHQRLDSSKTSPISYLYQLVLMMASKHLDERT
jgi:hypothetical protein